MVAYHQGNSGRPTTGRHRFSRYHQTELVRIGNFRLHPERRPQDHAAELYGTGLCLLLAYRHRQPLHRRKVNHKLVPLSHKLQSGDQVEILTSKSQRVQPEWEVYATTARARAKIAAILRKEAKAYQKEGETILNEFFKNEDIRMDDAALDKLTRLHGFHTRDELLVAIGNKRVVLGDADKNVFKEKQNSNWKKFLTFSFGNKDNKDAKEQPEEKTPQEKINTKQILKLTEETISKNYIMADCCIPFRVTTYWDTSTSKTVLSSTSANAPLPPALRVATETVSSPPSGTLTRICRSSSPYI